MSNSRFNTAVAKLTKMEFKIEHSATNIQRYNIISPTGQLYKALLTEEDVIKLASSYRVVTSE